jgi:hypothetical protein
LLVVVVLARPLEAVPEGRAVDVQRQKLCPQVRLLIPSAQVAPHQALLEAARPLALPVIH